MTRPNRKDYPGAIHHVYGRGNHKQSLFVDAEDCLMFLRKLSELAHETGLVLFTYCLMVNHYHLLIATGEVPLAVFMHRLLTSFSRYFNDKTGSVGHVFQGRYGDRLCADDFYFETLLAYIHLNPVKAGLTDRPEDWRWSGHRGLIAGGDSLVAREKTLERLPNGLSGYTERIEREILKFEGRKSPPQLPDLLQAICAQRGVQVSDLLGPSRTRDLMPARRAFMEQAMLQGYRASEIARALNRTPRAVTRLFPRISPSED